MATLQQMAGALVLRNDGNGTSAEEEEEKGGNETIAERIRKRVAAPEASHRGIFN
jgi:hypothetical protein